MRKNDKNWDEDPEMETLSHFPNVFDRGAPQQPPEMVFSILNAFSARNQKIPKYRTTYPTSIHFCGQKWGNRDFEKKIK